MTASWKRSRRWPRPTVAPTTYVRVRALVELVATHLDNGAIDAAQDDAWTRCAARSIARCPGAGVRTLVARCAADVALATDEVDDAERWVGEIVDPFWQPVGRPGRARASRPRRGTRRARRRRPPVQSTRRGARPAASGGRRASTKRRSSTPTVAVETAVAHGMVQTVAAQGQRRRRTRRTLCLARTDRMARSCAPRIGQHAWRSGTTAASRAGGSGSSR